MPPGQVHSAGGNAPREIKARVVHASSRTVQTYKKAFDRILQVSDSAARPEDQRTGVPVRSTAATVA